MRAEIEIGGSLNTGVNGVLLRNCSIASGETAASQNYIQNFRKSRKIKYRAESYSDISDSYKILAAFKSRQKAKFYIITEKKPNDNKFQIWSKHGIDGMLFNHNEIAKEDSKFNFSYDYGKVNKFENTDCILISAFNVLVAISELNGASEEYIQPIPGKIISSVCSFANRTIATCKEDDYYYFGDVLEVNFTKQAASEYGNDITQAVKRTGSRLAVFTTKTIEIKDISNDPELPFQGYLYQNNYDVGAIIPTLLSLFGQLYFIGEDYSGLRFIYTLMDGELKKLTTETQALLFDGYFDGAGFMQEGARVFYCVYGSRDFGIDVMNGSLFEIEGGRRVYDYIREGGKVLQVAGDGFYLSEAGSDAHAGTVRLPKYDFGGVANIKRLSFIGEFMESGRPAVATLTGERGLAKQAEAHGRGFDFFLIGIHRLNDLEFSVNANFRLTKIIADYQILSNYSYGGY